MNLTKLYWYIRTQIVRLSYGHIGKHSYLAPVMFVQRRRKVFIGNNVRIYPGMRAELTKESAEIHIGDNVSIGQNFHVVCYEGALGIGKNTTISGNVFISNVDHGYTEIDRHVLEQKMSYKETLIGENCFIGYGAVILPGTKLGRQCIVGANAVVSGVFPDYSVIVGSPGRIVKKYNASRSEWVKA